MEKEQLHQKHTEKEAKLLTILIGCKTCMLLEIIAFSFKKKFVTQVENG